MQYPNVLIDEIMPLLKPSAVKVMNLIVRNTFGRQKFSDEMSLSHIQRLTKLGREAVVKANRALKALGVVTIKSGAPGGDSNIYTLNINPDTGELVRKPNQFENRTSSVGSSKSELSQTHTKPTLFSIENNAPIRAPRIPDPRVKNLINTFCKKFEAKVGSVYVPTWGKDGTLLKQPLASGYGEEQISETMDRYFADDYHAKVGFDIGRFCASFNRMVSAKPGTVLKQDGDPRRVHAAEGKYAEFD